MSKLKDRVKGALYTQVSDEELRKYEKLNISYSQEAADEEPEFVAVALISEALNIISDHYQEQLTNSELSAIKRRLIDSGNNHSDDVIKRYSLNDIGKAISIDVLTQHLSMIFDFSKNNATPEAGISDEFVDMSVSNELLNTALNSYLSNGLSPAGIAAMGSILSSEASLKAGAHRDEVATHLLQLINIVLSGKLG